MKMNFSKGFAGRLTGGLVGGAATAVIDKYVMPMLGESVAGYSDYVKIALGVALPAVAKGNAMVGAIGDSLIAVGCNNVVSGLLTGSGSDSNSDSGSGGVSGVAYVNGGNYPNYRAFVNSTPTKEKKNKENNAVSAVR